MENEKHSSLSDLHYYDQSKKTKTTHAIETLVDEMPNLPLEMIAEILVRLPMKSLLKFRCVSKSWLSLISSPKFINTHLENSVFDPTLSNYRVMLNIWYPQYNLKHCSVNSVFRDPVMDAVDIDYPDYTPNRETFSFVGSCRGLLCAVTDGLNVFLWNPTLRMFKKLPVVDVELHEFLTFRYGFGYDESNDDYKVVGIFWSIFPGGDATEYVVKIYSSKNDSWNRIEDFKGGHPSDGSGNYVNGKLHFLADLMHNNTHIGRNIATLDLETEVYGTLELPNYEGCSDLSMGVLKGCLSVLCSYTGYDVLGRADVWVLEEYGTKETWIKVVSVPYVGGPLMDYNLCRSPLSILSCGKVLLRHGSQLVIYNQEDSSYKFPRTVDHHQIHEASIYLESLIPLRK